MIVSLCCEAGMDRLTDPGRILEDSVSGADAMARFDTIWTGPPQVTVRISRRPRVLEQYIPYLHRSRHIKQFIVQSQAAAAHIHNERYLPPWFIVPSALLLVFPVYAFCSRSPSWQPVLPFLPRASREPTLPPTCWCSAMAIRSTASWSTRWEAKSRFTATRLGTLRFPGTRSRNSTRQASLRCWIKT